MKNSSSSLSTVAVIDVCKWYTQAGQKLDVLNKVSLTFIQGMSYAITGASGSGKSTLLHILGGLDTPCSGKVLYNGYDLAQVSVQQKETILKTKVGFVFQFHYLIKELTALENIALPGRIVGLPQDVLHGRAYELLKKVGLADKGDCYVRQLSGGEQQRVAIARALFNKPRFLFADEPTGNLDAYNADLVVDLLQAYQQEWNMGMILCTHDRTIARRMDNEKKMEKGGLI